MPVPLSPVWLTFSGSCFSVPDRQLTLGFCLCRTGCGASRFRARSGLAFVWEAPHSCTCRRALIPGRRLMRMPLAHPFGCRSLGFLLCRASGCCSQAPAFVEPIAALRVCSHARSGLARLCVCLCGCRRRGCARALSAAGRSRKERAGRPRKRKAVQSVNFARLYYNKIFIKSHVFWGPLGVNHRNFAQSSHRGCRRQAASPPGRHAHSD